MPRVMAIDDDTEILSTLTEFLTMRGYDVVSADNAGDAFMLMDVAPPDVVLLNIGMPKLDGVSALQGIRQSHPDVPVIMLTGNADLARARETLTRGAFDYVAKPFDFDHLEQVVAMAVVHRPG